MSNIIIQSEEAIPGIFNHSIKLSHRVDLERGGSHRGLKVPHPENSILDGPGFSGTCPLLSHSGVASGGFRLSREPFN